MKSAATSHVPEFDQPVSPHCRHARSGRQAESKSDEARRTLKIGVRWRRDFEQNGDQVSDVSQGDGWWQASDGKWYPPESLLQNKPTFCTNCAAPTQAGALACGSCGFSPTSQKNFCANCGQPTLPGQVACTTCGTALATSPTGAPQGDKSKVAAGLLGIFLGGLGIHKFYLGRNNPGLIMLLVTLIGGILIIPALVMGIIGLIEGIIYLTKTDEQFYDEYVLHKKDWF